MNLKRLITPLIMCALVPQFTLAQQADFSHAVIFSPKGNSPQLQEAISVLQQVVEEHSNIHLAISSEATENSNPLIVVSINKQEASLPKVFQTALNKLSPTRKDGYKITFLKGKQTILIAGYDDRGALYGVGYLLRKVEMRQGQILVPDNLNISSTPTYPIRGHQLGYRPKTNAYDAWSVDQFDHYIRDLAIFGANSIEIMPPKTDDDSSNDHMKLPAIKMIAEQSRICKKYGLDVWMWYPNMGSDYTSPNSIQKELEERSKVFKVLPKLNALFVPGGDPGDLEPDVLFNFLKKLAVVLHQYHPNAKIWVSPQVFRPSQKWYTAFYKEVNRKYSWFGGVVYGPWVKEPIQQVRRLVDKEIPIRRYPDITHSLSSQYPIPQWDLAYAITLGRECYNPRPYEEKHIQNVFAKYAQGSISYSEGINDDVNKFVWSGQDWDPTTPVIETLRDYARLFIGPDYSETVAEGLISLENNLKGPLLVNTGVDRTLEQWKDMERNATPEVLSNFRFQMGLLRAYYDSYTRRRLIYETELEQSARDALKDAKNTGSTEAINKAIYTLEEAVKKPVESELRQRCFALADSVYRSISSQLTVKKPQEAQSGRGNFMDNIDLPLNDSRWLLSQCAKIEKLNTEKEKLQDIDKMLNRTNPGPGGFYDNLGSPESWKRVVHQKTWEEDPGGLESPLIDFGASLKGDEWVDILPVGFEGQSIPQAWMTQVTTLYDTPLILKYDHLDPHSSYIIKVAYTGRFNSKLKLVADGKYLIHDFIQTGKNPIYEFPVPSGAIADGKVEFTWTCGKGERGAQVAEVWLMKQQGK
ncbi:MAG: alpha-glucuronidase family glycosyl hydrolase [Bacteroidota bacterium]|nr:alpha-glucuronidase family glycosyl hydrolase [Bacteroidota bacterium]